MRKLLGNIIQGIGKLECSFCGGSPLKAAPLVSNYAPYAIPFLHQPLPRFCLVFLHFHQFICFFPESSITNSLDPVWNHFFKLIFRSKNKNEFVNVSTSNIFNESVFQKITYQIFFFQ